MKLRLANVSR